MTPEQRTALTRLIVDVIDRFPEGDTTALASQIVDQLDQRGYALVRDDRIPIRRNPNAPV